MAGGGRSNELDPETADQSSRRSKLGEEKEKVAKSTEEKESGGGQGEKISYGRKFAQTQEHYVARQMNRELEELAKQDGALEEEVPEQKVEAKPAAKSERTAEKKPTRSKMEELGRTAPIGAVPLASEPPPREAFGEVMTDALRYGAMIRSSVRDIFTATVRLARLPVELATLAAHRLRPLKT